MILILLFPGHPIHFDWLLAFSSEHRILPVLQRPALSPLCLQGSPPSSESGTILGSFLSLVICYKLLDFCFFMLLVEDLILPSVNDKNSPPCLPRG